jgi:hypothetical protein
VGIVLHEIARVPNSVKVSKKRLSELLEIIKINFKHNMSEEICYVVNEMINERYIEFDKVMEIMEIIKSFPDV